MLLISSFVLAGLVAPHIFTLPKNSLLYPPLIRCILVDKTSRDIRATFVFLELVLLVAVVMGLLVGTIFDLMRQKIMFAAHGVGIGIVVELSRRILTSGCSGNTCPVVEFQSASGTFVRCEPEYGSQPAIQLTR